jgi:hypothetical protein
LSAAPSWSCSGWPRTRWSRKRQAPVRMSGLERRRGGRVAAAAAAGGEADGSQSHHANERRDSHCGSFMRIGVPRRIRPDDSGGSRQRRRSRRATIRTALSPRSGGPRLQRVDRSGRRRVPIATQAVRGTRAIKEEIGLNPVVTLRRRRTRAPNTAHESSRRARRSALRATSAANSTTADGDASEARGQLEPIVGRTDDDLQSV